VQPTDWNWSRNFY